MMLQLIQHKDNFQIVSVINQTLLSFPFLLLVILIDMQMIRWISNKVLFRDNFILRLVVELSLGAVLSVSISLIANYVFLGERIFDQLLSKFILNVPSISAIFINFLMIFQLEFFFQYDDQRKKELEIIKLKSENSEYLYNQLRSQLNPHFLFNSLNVLSAQINADPQNAVLFTKKLSKIYRYVLNYDRTELIAVEKELAFASDYIEILKIRLGDHLDFSVELGKEERNKSIPPMTFQLLIENAVKHNIVSQDKKLHLRIYAEEDLICIENNKNPMKKSEDSNGIGLMNLNSRFKLVCNSELQITESELFFRVKIPTI
ncbi:sensor histidine kinase [Sediminitomix flava]|nr:histidine kinase [Sediminitomix flava]